ncbi:MAG: AAA family ATPase [Actinobacteria bacterium]|nr:AAA family ATPase [Actinomycetota bacterium]
MTAVRALTADALAGRGGALFVAGEAGLGKTTVLEYAVATAAGRFAVGTGRADVAEAALPFGLIGQALDAVLTGPAGPAGPGEPDVPAGPGVPAWAAGDRSAPAPADYFHAVLAGLRRAAAAGPVFLALDDVHWADRDSLTLLRLICRRIPALPVAVVVTTRPWPPEALRAGEELAAQRLASVQHLAPLSGEAALAFLRQRVVAAGPGYGGRPAPARLAPGDLARAAGPCAGNPLLLDHVATLLRAGQGIPDPAPGPGISWARRLLLSHLAGLGEPAVAYLRAAAVLGRRFRPEVAAQVAGLAAGGAAEAQEAFATAGLGSLTSDGWAEFSHELIRQAVYELAAPVRARLHEAAFRALAARGASPAEAAGHAVAARLEGDALAVAVAARAGREAMAAGAVAAARRQLQAAVDLAIPPAPAELVFDLGRALTAAGDHQAAMAVYQELLARADLPAAMRMSVLVQLSHAQLTAGRTAEAGVALAEVVRLAGPGDRDLAAGAMTDHAAQVLVSYGWKQAAPLAARARELAAGAAAPVRAAADGVWAVGTYFSGDPAGLDAGEAAARTAAAAPAWRPSGAPWWDTVTQYAMLALSAERFGVARRLLDGIIEAAQRRSDPLGMAIALMFRTRLSWRQGELEAALALNTRLIEYTDLAPIMTAFAAADRAVTLLDLGRLDEAADWSARADEALAGGATLGYLTLPVHLPRGTLALRRGDPAAASAAFSAMRDLAEELEVRDPGTIPWAADAIAAYLACGRADDAERLIRWLEPVASALPARWPKVAVAGGRAALAEYGGDAAQAGQCYLAALALARQLPIPLARAQLLTDYGGFLHRQGDASQARGLLGEALRLAESCGSGWHAEQARAQYRRAGGRAGTTPPGQLTPQEAAVARLARAGKTNREIAAQLYLSVNTVETHLRHIYQKLGIHRRVELMALPETWAPAPGGPQP